MTCVIATRRFVCADRRIAEDGGSFTSIVKVCKNPWLIAAAAGLGTAILAVKRAMREGAEAPADLLDAVGKGSCALVLSWDGVLTHISEGVIWSVREPATAIGSGGDLALGYLHGAGAFTPRVAREAQRFVARRRADCGSGCDIRSFD